MINRFRQLKEEESKKKVSKALADDEVQTPASASDSEDGSDQETKDKVKIYNLML
jgi:YidC/Oxa1 family membrane protein insertase